MQGHGFETGGCGRFYGGFAEVCGCHPEKEYIVATESGILHEMQKKCPQTKFIPAPPNDSTCACNECNFMRLNTLEKLYNCLKDESPEIKVDAEIAEKAVKPIKRMLEISAKLGL